MQGNLKLYGLFVGLTVTIMITCDTLVYKVFDIYGFKITASGIVFSLCFLISTLLTEVYGYSRARRVIWVGFAALIFMAAMSAIVVAMPPAASWTG